MSLFGLFGPKKQIPPPQKGGGAKKQIPPGKGKGGGKKGIPPKSNSIALAAIVAGTVLLAAGMLCAHRNDPGRSTLLLTALLLFGLLGRAITGLAGPRRWEG